MDKKALQRRHYAKTGELRQEIHVLTKRNVQLVNETELLRERNETAYQNGVASQEPLKLELTSAETVAMISVKRNIEIMLKMIDMIDQ